MIDLIKRAWEPVSNFIWDVRLVFDRAEEDFKRWRKRRSCCHLHTDPCKKVSDVRFSASGMMRVFRVSQKFRCRDCGKIITIRLDDL